MTKCNRRPELEHIQNKLQRRKSVMIRTVKKANLLRRACCGFISKKNQLEAELCNRLLIVCKKKKKGCKINTRNMHV